MRVAAVIVNWNGGEENLACLRSLLAQGLAPRDLVFVDNASRDGSVEAVERAFPGLCLLRNATNLGFGAAANQGIAAALASDYQAVFLVNNDVELPPEALARLCAALERDRSLGVVGPLVLYKHDRTRVWAAGGRLTFRENLSTLLGHGRPDGPEWRRSRPVDYIVGCAMLVRREVFEKVGLLEAGYFAYHEDLEFCLKASEAGFGVWVVGEAEAWHTTSGSTGGGYSPRRKYMMGVNTVWFLRKHGTPMRWLRFVVFDVLTLPPLLLAGLFRGRGRAVLAKARGMWDGAMGRRVMSELLEEGSTFLW